MIHRNYKNTKDFCNLHLIYIFGKQIELMRVSNFDGFNPEKRVNGIKDRERRKLILDKLEKTKSRIIEPGIDLIVE